MQQSKSLFFAIIALAVVVVAGMFLARLFLAEELNLPVGVQEISIQVVVAPSIKPWVDQAARDFNQANSNTQVKIIAADKLIPESQFQVNPQTASEVPVAWLAEATFAVEMARNAGLQFEDAQSVASTSLAWGAYNDKLDRFTQDYGSLTWQNLHAKAANPDDILKLVIASPQNSAEGLAALISAAAAQLNAQTLSGNDISAVDGWLTETLGDRNAQIPPKPAETFASVQGRTIGDVGILSMASWRRARLDQSTDFTITPAEPGVTLDYPFAIWTGRQSTPEAQKVARDFRAFLLSNAQQNALADFFFEPAGAIQGGVQADREASQRLLNWADRVLR